MCYNYRDRTEKELGFSYKKLLLYNPNLALIYFYTKTTLTCFLQECEGPWTAKDSGTVSSSLDVHWSERHQPSRSGLALCSKAHESETGHGDVEDIETLGFCVHFWIIQQTTALHSGEFQQKSQSVSTSLPTKEYTIWYFSIIIFNTQHNRKFSVVCTISW